MTKKNIRFKSWVWALLLGFAGFVFFLSYKDLQPTEPQTSITNPLSGNGLPKGFQRAAGPRDWKFPVDFGPHPDYQTEWWYYTGNLQSEAGHHFGFQLTFFRRALLPTIEVVARDSKWATDQIYMAHFALSDVAEGEHYAFENFSRGAVGLAGAQADPYQVWLENWEVIQTTEGQYHLRAQQGDVAMDLSLEDLKGPIFHGNQGYSQKGPEAGNASYYYSQTRLRTTGWVQTANGRFSVNGLSWKDHEFSTSALSAGQIGWDWFSIQLDDGSELMFFQLRRSDGSIDSFSSGTWVSPESETTALEWNQFEIQVRDYWRSPHSEARYPIAWTVMIPSLNMTLEIASFLPDQEMDVSYTYWEGAVHVDATVNDVSVSGSGYVEMTGYAASMEGEF